MKEYNNKKRNSVFGGIGVAALLCVLMVLMSWSAMVTNSDINSVVTENSETQDVKTDNIVKTDVESPVTNFEPEVFGFEEENEMLGMRTVNSKTYLDEDGKLNAVVSNKALHYENHLGQLVDLDTSIKTWDNGFYVEDIYTPVYFGIHAYDGLTMHFGDSELATGINPVPVIVKTGLPSEVQLPGLKGQMVNSVEDISTEYFAAPTEFVEIGGSSISYPMTSNMDLIYHVSENLVKQELVLDSLTPDFEVLLEESTVKTADAEHMESMFGLKETMVLPEGTQLWAGDHLITADDGVFEYNSELLIKDSVTGQRVAFIQAPVAMDG
ncbi:MAG: hypothetical protein P8Q94_04965, partial [Candidatus Poseidoniaceae archaeon]|nr:hypothetical protein [Candidatus Poseidoniaceae archaeon]